MAASPANVKAAFVRDSDGGYRVVGGLVFATARDLLTQSAPAFASDGDLAIDLSNVDGADSAGLALLIEWSRLANERQRVLRFAGAPAQLRALAKISDLDDLLPFT